jgi:hypothetical protein
MDMQLEPAVDCAKIAYELGQVVSLTRQIETLKPADAMALYNHYHSRVAAILADISQDIEVFSWMAEHDDDENVAAALAERHHLVDSLWRVLFGLEMTLIERGVLSAPGTA